MNSVLLYDKPVSWNELQKIKDSIFNHFHIKVFGITASGLDTSFTYFLYTELKLSKNEINNLHYFISGILSII